MSRKRTKLEVIKDILEVLKNHRRVKITHLIYKSNLSNNSIKKYINELLSNKLISLDNVDSKKFYILTGKGRDFLNEFSQIKIFSESYGLNEFL